MTLRILLVAAALVLAMFNAALAPSARAAGCAADISYAPQEFDFSELQSLPGKGYGTIESVHEVQFDGPFKGAFAAFEHAIRPEVVDRLIVRLDDGGAVVLLQEETDRFELGQRVRVVVATDGAQLETE